MASERGRSLSRKSRYCTAALKSLFKYSEEDMTIRSQSVMGSHRVSVAGSPAAARSCSVCRRDPEIDRSRRSPSSANKKTTTSGSA